MSEKTLKKVFQNKLVELLEGPATATALGLNFPQRKALIEGGFIKVAGKATTGKRGRPQHVFKLTDKGRKRAKTAQKQLAAQEETEVTND